MPFGEYYAVTFQTTLIVIETQCVRIFSLPIKNAMSRMLLLCQILFKQNVIKYKQTSKHTYLQTYMVNTVKFT